VLLSAWQGFMNPFATLQLHSSGKQMDEKWQMDLFNFLRKTS